MSLDGVLSIILELQGERQHGDNLPFVRPTINLGGDVFFLVFPPQVQFSEGSNTRRFSRAQSL